MTLVFMFPGQSSRDPEMLERLRGREDAMRVIEEASDVLKRDILAHYSAANESAFETNRDVQVGVFVANHAHLRSLEARGVRASLSLGLSLGEYNHLVHIGAVDFADALRLVEARGAAYDAGPRGAMISVFPLALEDLEPIVERARAHGPIAIANLNSPMQNVIAGSPDALAAACVELEDAGCACVLIESRVPMHSPMFEPAAEVFRPALERAPWRSPALGYLPNVTARPEPSPSCSRIAELLRLHVHCPVLWRASVDFVADSVTRPVFVEVGPRSVLCNLLSRSWHKVPRFHTDVDAFDMALEEIARAA